MPLGTHTRLKFDHIIIIIIIILLTSNVGRLKIQKDDITCKLGRLARTTLTLDAPPAGDLVRVE